MRQKNLLRFSKKKFSNFIYPALIVLVVGAFLFIPKLVKVSVIECSSQFGPCSESVSQKLSGFSGETLPDAKKQISGYLVSLPQVKDFSLRFKLPSTLVVSILEAKARFALKDAGSELYAVISEDGEVLSLGEETSLPYAVVSDRPPNLGEKVGEKSLFAAKMMARLYSAYSVRSGEMGPDYLKVALPEGYSVFFPLEGDMDSLMGALALIVYELNKPSENSRIETGISTIDLRFANPVLR